ncbi:hypothetical protein [Xanthocytophaga agilis]|uniref:Uncharacterized protein n=1 Tax=Xanthocytophaga agilis TaxID=3048010 RepID=A0AAE3RBL2_9BACT|nr:hypothetical protein [Xanthocytophaga agilis]MDJ1505164.1 hypothetical protein [Xanthocytophaga agilis]
MGKVIAKLGIKKKTGHLYYLNSKGDLVETEMTWFKSARTHHTSSAMDGFTRKRKKKAAPRKKTSSKRRS